MAISNTFTNLKGIIYSAVDQVSRELVGMVPSATVNTDLRRAAKGETVYVPYSLANTAADIAPAMTVPAPSDRTVSTISMTLSKARTVAFGITGEETQGLNTGIGASWYQQNEIAQAIRTLCNEMEADGVALYKKMSRGYGTAGTTPFASDLSDTAQVRKILADNGAPVEGGWRLVIDTTAGAKMRTLTNLTKANEAGGDSLLRQGVLLDVHGGMIRESGQISTHTAGTAASATTDTTGYAVGSTSITLASAGTGTILAGDLITFAGDTNKYLVVSGDADVSGGGTITLAAPGLRVAIGTSATAITVVKNGTTLKYTPNLVFTPNAVMLAVRPPAMPPEGDAAFARMTVVDPRSGIPFEFAAYKGFHQNRYEVSAVWGWAVVKPEHTAILIG